MIVAEWLGGPNDGETLALKDDMKEVVVALQPAFSFTAESDEPIEVEIRKLAVPVELRDCGYGLKWYLVWADAR